MSSAKAYVASANIVMKRIEIFQQESMDVVFMGKHKVQKRTKRCWPELRRSASDAKSKQQWLLPNPIIKKHELEHVRRIGRSVKIKSSTAPGVLVKTMVPGVTEI